MRNTRVVQHSCLIGMIWLVVIVLTAGTVFADETCQSPFLPKVTGQEDYVYVWTLGIEGVGDGNDSLVTVDVNPKSKRYGQIIHRAPVPGRHEAHHAGFTDDRRHLWAGGLDDSYIFIFDVASDPAKPKLIKTIKSFVKDTGGLVGPHTFYALPGRMLITALSNTTDGSGRTGLAEYTNDGRFIRTIWMPKEAPYGYDVRVNINLNRMLTSAFTGKKNFMRPLGELVKDTEAMKAFGDTVVVWDFHARKPLQVLQVPGAPLELRWALQPNHYYAFTATALAHQLVLIHQQDDRTWAARSVTDLGDTLPVDISIAPDDSKLYVASFMDGMLRVYDIANPFEPKLVEQVKVGEMANMVSESWDGTRLYVTNSLLSKWDKPGDYWMKAYAWENGKLTHKFTTDFNSVGRAHLMNFGSKALRARPE
ncbi:MAG: selenium-binding protein [Candidatus Methylomirabilota bacterium]|nr:selenium-binding family protein [Candidatus Methylomirabilis sp.]NJD69160.1 selenium-binding protein [candidate division NC10 bacterium]PWB47563.1 MAG: selenium-binding protein [candidate division NC10 bacterium]